MNKNESFRTDFTFWDIIGISWLKPIKRYLNSRLKPGVNKQDPWTLAMNKGYILNYNISKLTSFKRIKKQPVMRPK